MMEDAITKQEHRGGHWYTFGSLGENRTPRRLNGVGNRDPEDGGHYHQSVTPKRTGRDTDDKRQFSQGGHKTIGGHRTTRTPGGRSRGVGSGCPEDGGHSQRKMPVENFGGRE